MPVRVSINLTANPEMKLLMAQSLYFYARVADVTIGLIIVLAIAMVLPWCVLLICCSETHLPLVNVQQQAVRLICRIILSPCSTRRVQLL